MNDAGSGLMTEVAGIRTVTEALRWSAARRPPAVFVDAVQQDEFTFDVVLRVAGATYVVFDTN